jgi:superfamily II DNA or RNA helicase
MATTSRPLPRLTEEELIELAGGVTVRHAKDLVLKGAVKRAAWKHPLVTAEVNDGQQGTREVELDLQSTTFFRNSCGCDVARRRKLCVHAVAAYLQNAIQEGLVPKLKPSTAAAVAAAKAPAETKAAPAAEPGTGPRLKSLVLSSAKGTPIEVRFLIPPNLAAAAPRDQIIARLELRVDGRPVAPENLDRGKAWNLDGPTTVFLAIVENLCSGKLQGILPLTRRHLRQLLAVGKGLPIFRMANAPDAPLAWSGDALERVSAHLEGESAPASAAPGGEEEDEDEGPGRPSEDRGEEHRPWVDGSVKWLCVRLPQQATGPTAELRELLQRSGFMLDTVSREWRLRGTLSVLNFFARHWKVLRDQQNAYFTHNLAHSLRNVAFARAKCDAREEGDGFRLAIGIDPEGASPKVVAEAVAGGRMFFYTPRGPRLISPELLDSIKRAQGRILGDARHASRKEVDLEMDLKVGYAELASADAIAEEIQAAFAPPETWTKRSAAIRNLSKLRPAPIEPELDGKLRDYQRLGVAWLWHLHRNNLGGLLADEMGLGKTVQALAFLQAVRRERADDGPCLVVCPASLVENWRREARRFTPGLRALAHHGQNRRTDAEAIKAHDLVVTSYGTLARDIAALGAIPWGVVICDEGQNIKNPRAQAAKAVKQLHAKGRFILTGTPVENSLEDLRSLFGFLMPGYLPKPEDRGVEEAKWHDERLLAMAAPYILRRSKAVVAKELPEKIEQVLYCDFEDRQDELYREVQESTRKAIFEMEMGGASEASIRMAAFNQLLRLRQVCADPRILQPRMDEADSAKLQAFLELLEESRDAGHRMLVFSTFVSALTLIRKALEDRGIRYAYLDGSTRDRQGVCDTFNGDDGIPVLLMSLKAGGTGLNLTGADTVVHYDPWWNPAAEAQATDRAHRIGQTRKVTSIKLIASGTIEERVMELQRSKSEMLRKLLSESDAASAKISLAEIKALLED